MVYLLKMGIFHGYVSHKQMVLSVASAASWADPRTLWLHGTMCRGGWIFCHVLVEGGRNLAVGHVDSCGVWAASTETPGEPWCPIIFSNVPAGLFASCSYSGICLDFTLGFGKTFFFFAFLGLSQSLQPDMVWTIMWVDWKWCTPNLCLRNSTIVAQFYPRLLSATNWSYCFTKAWTPWNHNITPHNPHVCAYIYIHTYTMYVCMYVGR